MSVGEARLVRAGPCHLRGRVATTIVEDPATGEAGSSQDDRTG